MRRRGRAGAELSGHDAGGRDISGDRLDLDAQRAGWCTGPVSVALGRVRPHPPPEFLMPMPARSLAPLWLIAVLCWPADARGQMPPADTADVGTIEGIVHAYYDVINGPAGAPRQWRRDSTLYMPGATFVAMRESAGKPAPDIMTPEQFRQAVDHEMVEQGFFETEIGHRIELFGHVAQVRSVYETRHAAKAPLLGRGAN